MKKNYLCPTLEDLALTEADVLAVSGNDNDGAFKQDWEGLLNEEN